MRNREFIVLAAVGAALLYAEGRYLAQTAGDSESNIIEDGLDDMANIITGWPIGSGPYQGMIERASAQHGVPVPILAWQLWKECRYRAAIIDGTVRSPAGAIGIAQFMPATAVQYLGSADAALDPARAIPACARMMADLYRKYGNWTRALAAYNWGQGNLDRKGYAAAPAETRDYVAVILDKANQSSGARYA